MIADDIPYLINDINKQMPFHSDNIATIPRTFKPLPKKLMEESHKVDNKFLNNHLGEIEEAVHKKLLNKIPFIQQQKKYHEKSGILNHDNFFHADLATGTPISNDNFKHSQFMLNSFLSAGACTGGDELETFTTGGYGNFSHVYLVTCNSDTTVGVIGECYDQFAVDCSSCNDNIRLGSYSDDSGDPDVLYAQTASIPMTCDYAYKSLDEFTLTSTKTWLTISVESDNTILEGGERVGDERWSQTQDYEAFPDPATSISWSSKITSEAQLRRMKLGHS